jgi:hypothetical protein
MPRARPALSLPSYSTEFEKSARVRQAAYRAPSRSMRSTMPQHVLVTQDPHAAAALPCAQVSEQLGQMSTTRFPCPKKRPEAETERL